MTTDSNSIVITAIGAHTPVGANAEQTCAAIAAGINRISEHAYYECTPEDPEWDEPLPLYVADVPTIDPFVDGADRLIELALPALTEVMGKAKFKRRDLENCGLMLALPQADKTIQPMNLAANFVPALCRRTGLSTFKLWKTSQAGHTGVFTLLQSAIQKLQAGDLNACLVGGVDSYLMEDRLNHFDTLWRLRSERNVDGFIPGEAAVLVLLETAAQAKARGARPLARLGPLGEGAEAEILSSKKQSTGQGLTTAITQALAAPAAPGCDKVYCSMNGESYYAFEWGITLARLHESLQNVKELLHPADCVGDVGAATGALLMACAALGPAKPPKSAAFSLLWTASDTDHRMALTLQPGDGT